MSQFQYSPEAVWPQPDDGLTYVRQSFPNNGVFVSTGQFDPADIGPSGQGRTSANCKRVTSLFFDADLITAWDAMRRFRGEELEEKVAIRKASLYALPDEDVLALKDVVGAAIHEALTDLMGCEPTAVIDSGWGFHYHYAVDEFTPADHPTLKSFHIAVVAEVNRRIAQEFEGVAMKDYCNALDNTNDVGARLARVVGSINSKCAEKPKEVFVFYQSTNATCIYPAHLPEILAKCVAPTQANSPAATPAASKSSGKLSRVHTDFRKEYLTDGRSFREVVDGMTPGEKLNVICPFGGTSVGSGFFVLDRDYRCRFTSNATNTVYIDTSWGLHPDLNNGGNGGNGGPPPSQPPPTPAAPHSGRVPRNPAGRATLTMRRDREGQPTNIPEPLDANLIRVLTEDGRFDFWYDDWHSQEMNGNEPISETIYMNVRLILETDYNWTMHKPGKELIWDAIKAVCAAPHNRFNPVQEYLRSLKWDGVERLNSWIYHAIHKPGIDVGVAPTQDTALHEIYARKWLISAVARAMTPGCKVDTMFILYGLQSFQKSGIWRVFGGQYFVDSKFDPESKDAYMIINRAWIYEDAELASGGRARSESRKAFLSSQEDTYRTPYARGVRTTKRHCVLVGTTNEADFLKDRTGDRRYWVVTVPRIPHLPSDHPDQPQADLEWLRTNRDQLFAEAYAAFVNGEQYWLTKQEDQRRSASNDPFRQETIWDECANAVFAANAGGLKNAITLMQFGQACDSNMSPADVAKLATTLCACLDGAGFHKGRKVKGRTLWYKPLPAGVEPLDDTGLHAAGRAPLKFDEDSFRRGRH